MIAILVIVCLEGVYLELIPFFIPDLIITFLFPDDLSNQKNYNYHHHYNVNINVNNDDNMKANSPLILKITKMVLIIVKKRQ